MENILAKNDLKVFFSFPRKEEMKSFLYTNPSYLAINNDELNKVEILQIDVPFIDGNNNKSKVDILAKYGNEYFAIIEVNHFELTEIHLSRLENKLKIREQIIQSISPTLKSNDQHQTKWIGLLVGTSINPDLLIKIKNNYCFENKIPIMALILSKDKEKVNIFNQ